MISPPVEFPLWFTGDACQLWRQAGWENRGEDNMCSGRGVNNQRNGDTAAGGEGQDGDGDGGGGGSGGGDGNGCKGRCAYLREPWRPAAVRMPATAMVTATGGGGDGAGGIGAAKSCEGRCAYLWDPGDWRWRG